MIKAQSGLYEFAKWTNGRRTPIRGSAALWAIGPSMTALSITMANKLTIRFSDRKIDELLIKRGALSIGRKADNDIRLEDITVSSHHAELVKKDHQCLIHDLGSTNGTYVNGAPVRERTLFDGDVIVIGKYSLSYEEIEAEPLSIELDPTLQLKHNELKTVINRFDARQATNARGQPPGPLQWIAQDENGVWWGFENEPIPGVHGWMDESDGRKVLLKQERQNNAAWKDTLRKL